MPEQGRYRRYPLPYHDPLKVFARFAGEPYSLLLHSQRHDHPGSNCSYIAIRPECVFEATAIDFKEKFPAHRAAISFLLNKFKAVTEQKNNNTPSGFIGGIAGFFSYEAGAASLLPLPLRTRQPFEPLYSLGFYPAVAAYDHRRQQTWLTVIEGASRHSDEHWRQVFDQPPSVFPANREARLTFTPVQPPEVFRQRVERVRDYIAAGDICQANIAQEFTAALPATTSPYAVFCRLAKRNPAPYAAFYHTLAQTLLSASPEQFLGCHNRHIISKPIKGTAPRHSDAALDAQTATILRCNEKDLAENRMITDLLRNDLSQSCVPGSVRVPAFAALESFAGVHHLVSTITGQLTPDTPPLEAFLKAMPGGSITGAPKKRAMEIIAELEGQPRGAYCGSIGYWGVNGGMDSSILIRTLVLREERISLHTGCGITWHSNPHAELQESLDKAAPIIRALS